MDVSLLIRLIDQASAPAKKIADSLRGIGDVAGEMKRGFGDAIRQGFSVDNIETATRNAEAALQRARSRLVGAVGMAITLAAPVLKAGDFQEAFIDFANVAEIPLDRMQEIEAQLVAATRETGKNKSELLQILSTYVGKGMDLDQSLAAIRATGRAATATKADVADMSKAGFAVMDNLDVDAGSLGKAFDVMAQSGKEGSFELKDMARTFPELTAGAAALKMKGVPAVASLAAALQIAMKSAGSADQAANNMSNFLGKITSADAVKNFKEMGIDIEKELKSATERGADPLLTALQLIDKATDGGDQFKMNELFADKQVKDFLLALIPNLEEYQRIRDKAAGAEGVIDRDWINVTAGFKAQIKALATELDNLFSSGGALLPIAQELITGFNDIVKQVNEWTAANPELTETIVKGVAALLAANIALRVFAFGIAAARLPIIGLFSTFLKFNKEGKNIATGWRVLAGLARGLSPAMTLLAGSLLRVVRLVPALRNAIAGLTMLSAISSGGAIGAAWTGLAAAISAVGAALATISAPAWIVIGALTAAGFAVWKFWDRISSFASGFASVIAEAFSAAGSHVAAFAGRFGSAFAGVFSSVGSRLSSFADRFAKFHAALFGIDPAAVDRFKASIAEAFDFSEWIESARTAIADFWSNLGSLFSAETLTDGEKENMYNAGRALAQRLVDGIKEFLLGSVGLVGELLTFDLKINWPEPPAWLTWLVERHQAAAAAAKKAVDEFVDWTFPAEETPEKADVGATRAGDTASDSSLEGLAERHNKALGDVLRAAKRGVDGVANWWNGTNDQPAAENEDGQKPLDRREVIRERVEGAAPGEERVIKEDQTGAGTVRELIIRDKRSEVSPAERDSGAGKQAAKQVAVENAGTAPADKLRRLVDRHNEIVGVVADAVKAGFASASSWWNGTDEKPGAVEMASTFAKDVTGADATPNRVLPSTGAQPSAETQSSGVLAEAWAGFKSTVGLAGNDLATGGQQGGKAIADGGREAAQAISGAAAELRSAASSISAAAASARAAQASARKTGGVAAAISSARTGALAGGTE